MTFVVDCMLGKLSKWLRILGFDTLYDSSADDDRLLADARRDGRVLLSRDTGLLARAGELPKLAVKSESWPEQVEQVLDAFDLWSATAPYTRCLDCNVRLRSLSREAARNLVPAHVADRAEEFTLCPSCGRVFWPGTHYRAMEEKLSRLRGRRA